MLIFKRRPPIDSAPKTCRSRRRSPGSRTGSACQAAKPRRGNRRCCECVRTPLAAAHGRPSLGSPATGSRDREPTVAAPTRRPGPPHSHPTTCSPSYLGQAGLGPGSPMVCRLARASEDGHTRYGGALASAGLAAVLALEVPLSRWPTASESRATGVDRDHVPREPTLGYRTDPRRAAQARYRRQQPLDSALPLAWTEASVEPDLADVPTQPRPSPVG